MMEKYWSRVTGDDPKIDMWEKGDMHIMINPAIVCLCPAEECENYFYRTDMMTVDIFVWSLLGIVLGERQGRQIVWDNFDRDEALWFLGWLGMVPTAENSEKLRKSIEKAAKGA